MLLSWQNKRAQPLCLLQFEQYWDSLYQKNILPLVDGFASQAAAELPFLITRHSHTNAEQLIRAGLMEAILVRVKGLWIDSFALLMGLTIANLTRTKFQFEIVASIMFTDHQT